MQRIIPFLTPQSKRQVLPILGIWICLFATLDHLLLTGLATLGLQDVLWMTFASTIVFVPFCLLLMWIASRKERFKRRLKELNTTDPLTGLPNRTQFIRSMVNRDWMQGNTLCIFSIDEFRQINDEFGHTTGDSCLEAVAQKLAGSLPQGHLLGRISGSEFAAALPVMSRSALRKLIMSLAKGVAFKQADGPGAVLMAKLTVGAAFWDGEMDKPLILGKADAALQLAKIEGDTRLVIWDGVFSAAA